VDRDAIERRDFPVGRRGYDQEAVDAHLRRVADEFETLRGRTPLAPRASSLAAGASEHVRLILEAAEAGAADLRADAERQAGEHVAKVKDAAGGMVSRLDELERELGGLLEALRKSGERLNEGLARLHEQAGELGAAAGDEALYVPDDLVAPEEPAAPDEQEAPEDGAPASDDEAGARLIALNMALSGTPREETARYLEENFDLDNQDAILDEVYARVGG
jgi:DivIVA domain-containing protein